MSAIEARSLSAVSGLADDPPTNPKDGPGPLQDGLILYIARVPGNRGMRPLDMGGSLKAYLHSLDIFLTPMKPLQKVVTAPDVESCLYYIHLDSADDEKLLNGSSTGAEFGTPKTVAEQPAKKQKADAVKRKPLPAHAQLGFDNRTMLSTGSYAHARLPIRSLGAKVTPDFQPTGLRGPRLMQPRLHTTEDPTLEPFFATEYTEQDDSAGGKSEQPTMRAPELPRRPVQLKSPKLSHPDIFSLHSGRSDLGANIDTDSFYQHARPNIMPVSDSQIPITTSNSDFSLTIIRRYNGLQANVGKVEHHTKHQPSNNVSPATKSHSSLKPSDGRTSIEILTPGYLKYDHNAINSESNHYGKAASQRHSNRGKPFRSSFYPSHRYLSYYWRNVSCRETLSRERKSPFFR